MQPISYQISTENDSALLEHLLAGDIQAADLPRLTKPHKRRLVRAIVAALRLNHGKGCGPTFHTAFGTDALGAEVQRDLSYEKSDGRSRR